LTADEGQEIFGGVDYCFEVGESRDIDFDCGLEIGEFASCVDEVICKAGVEVALVEGDAVVNADV
jgi:hypothetical protein